jgi:hypothetical protein
VPRRLPPRSRRRHFAHGVATLRTLIGGPFPCAAAHAAPTCPKAARRAAGAAAIGFPVFMAWPTSAITPR